MISAEKMEDRDGLQNARGNKGLFGKQALLLVGGDKAGLRHSALQPVCLVANQRKLQILHKPNFCIISIAFVNRIFTQLAGWIMVDDVTNEKREF